MNVQSLFEVCNFEVHIKHKLYYLGLIQDAKLRPRIGLGYSTLNFNLNNPPLDVSDEFEDSTTESGFNINLGVAFFFTPKFFGQIQYDFVKLSVNSEIPDSAYNENVNILKIGVGYRF